MAVNCDPSALAQAAKCFFCLNASTQMEVQTYLLQQIAGDTSTPSQLAQKAAAFMALNPSTLREIQTYLLCVIAGGV